MDDPRLFSPSTRWIWDGGDRLAYHRFLRFAAEVDLAAPAIAGAELVITAESAYQAWIGGAPAGQGPSKSGAGRRFVDRIPVERLLKPGRNRLEVLVLGLGVGTMTSCLGEAGLIFELRSPAGVLARSGPETLVRPEPARAKATVRRWLQPCLEDLDLGAAEPPWRPAVAMAPAASVQERRVPLPRRPPLTPRRVVDAGLVRLPDRCWSVRHKPLLVDVAQARSSGHWSVPALLVADLVAERDGTIAFTPTLGTVDWHLNGEPLFSGSGWNLGRRHEVRARVQAGANRLVGVVGLRRDHFEHATLAAFTEGRVELRNPFGPGGMAVVPLAPGEALQPPAMAAWEALAARARAVPDDHLLTDANPAALAVGARVLPAKEPHPALADGCLTLPPAPPGLASRVVLDLGQVAPGRVRCRVQGRAGARLIVALCEGVRPAPFAPDWPNGCNNAFAATLGDGPGELATFHAYGGRFLVLHNCSPAPLAISGLRFDPAGCGEAPLPPPACGDPGLERAWAMCAATVAGGTDDTFTDCPLHEQVNWQFDNRLAALADRWFCGSTAVAAHTILLFTEDGRPGRPVASHYPSAWEVDIPVHQAAWVGFCHDHWWHTADQGFLVAVLPRVEATLAALLARRGGDGLLCWPGAWHWVEWSDGRDDDHAVNASEQAALLEALAAGAELAEAAGRTDLAGGWRCARSDLAAAVGRLLWSPAAQAFADSRHDDGALSTAFTQSTNARLALQGVGGAAWTGTIARRIAGADPRLAVPGSPYGLLPLLDLFDREDLDAPLFRLVQDRCDQMAAAGDLTLWEYFPEFGARRYQGWPTRSRCHPVAAALGVPLLRRVLGVTFTAPGCACASLAPRPPAGMDAAEGAVPTPLGPLQVSWRRTAGGLEVRHQAPPGMMVRVVPGRCWS